MKELPVPAVVRADPMAKELIRVWAAAGKQHISIATGLWEDPASWGLALVDLARHIALAYAETLGRDAALTLERIKEGFDVEWKHPTD